MSNFGADGPTDGEDPLAAMGDLFGNLSRMMGGTNQWESAAQIAAGIANDGRSENNVEPADRMAVEQLARVAELQVQQATGRDLPAPLRVEPLNRSQWARRFLDDQRPILEGMADSLGRGLSAQLSQLGDPDDPDGLELPAEIPGLGPVPPAMLAQLMAMMGPMMLSMMAGSTAGHMAARALGHYELPLPRPIAGPLTMSLANADEFAQLWSLPAQDIRLWVCLSDTVHHQVLSIPHVRQRLESLVLDYTAAFSQDPEEIEQQAHDLGLTDALEDAGADLAALQRMASDPDRLLGAMQSDRQREIIPQIQAVVAVIEGWVDHVLDSVGARLLSEYPRVTEALRRRRVEAGPQTRFVERLFGLELSQSTFDRGSAFVQDVHDRADEKALDKLWDDPEHLPTSSELDAPGLWMARVGIESREIPFEGDFEIPDSPGF